MEVQKNKSSLEEQKYSFIDACKSKLQHLTVNSEKLELKQKQRNLLAPGRKIQGRNFIGLFSANSGWEQGATRSRNQTLVGSDERSELSQNIQTGGTCLSHPGRPGLKRYSKGKRNLLLLLENDE